VPGVGGREPEQGHHKSRTLKQKSGWEARSGPPRKGFWRSRAEKNEEDVSAVHRNLSEKIIEGVKRSQKIIIMTIDNSVRAIRKEKPETLRGYGTDLKKRLS